MMQIVIAWVEAQPTWDGRPYAKDMGAHPGLRFHKEPRTVMWRRKATRKDLDGCRRHVRDELSEFGARIFTYPDSELDPFGRAKADVMVPAPECSICRKRHGVEVEHACE